MFPMLRNEIKNTDKVTVGIQHTMGESRISVREEAEGVLEQ